MSIYPDSGPTPADGCIGRVLCAIEQFGERGRGDDSETAHVPQDKQIVVACDQIIGRADEGIGQLRSLKILYNSHMPNCDVRRDQ
jgi:hypothetical protein